MNHGGKTYELVPQTPEQISTGSGCTGCCKFSDGKCKAPPVSAFDPCLSKHNHVWQEVKDANQA